MRRFDAWVIRPFGGSGGLAPSPPAPLPRERGEFWYYILFL